MIYTTVYAASRRSVQATDQMASLKASSTWGSSPLKTLSSRLTPPPSRLKTCHAVDYAMAFAKAARQLLLLQVHDPHQVRNLDGIEFPCIEEPHLGNRQPDFGKQVPTHTIELRQC